VSYDFVVLLAEVAGSDDATALRVGADTFEASPVADGDARLTGFLGELEQLDPGSDEHGWLSVWPLAATTDAVPVPTTYEDVEGNLATLLRLAARQGLVLVDLNAEVVHRPAPGLPVSVRTGDGTVLGALTRERLERLVAGLPASDPWLVLEKAPEVYAQTLRRSDDSFVLEHRVGGPDRHWSCEVSSADATVTRLWRWVDADDDWDEGLDWQPVTW
jgi:hypothetical protein